MSATAEKTNGRARGPRVPLLNAAEPPAPAVKTPSPGGSQLDGAVLIVQASASKLIRNAMGQVQNRTYGYVTLDAIVDEVLPLLVEQKLLWKAFPTTLDGEPALRYRMTHIPSGEYDEDVMKTMCAVPNPQGQGSGLTYARRYALTAYLNLTIDPDDDGAAASEAFLNHSAPQPSAQPAAQPTAAAARASDRPATAKQRTMLRTKARAEKLSDGALANVIKIAAGEPPASWADQAAAGRWLERALDRLPARLVDAVIAGIAHAAAEGSQA